ncbi:chorismate mutase family protein [Derxia lacustris]|uniref:hypothetical protein n=1 Tax=Derxia lacustris TaxID=764842 RepID=UPI000A17526B|nr:hypothetical protein [Derxia lacustris]
MRSRVVFTGLFALTLAGCAAPSIPGHGAAPAPAAPSAPTPSAAPAPVASPAPPAAVPPRPVAPAPINGAQLIRLDDLLGLTRELLNLAPDVARIRWNASQGKPATAGADLDAARGEAAARLAASYNADPELFRDYFRAQSEASRFVQGELFAQWKRAGAPPTMTLTRSEAQVQATSDKLTPRLMRALADAAPGLRAGGARAAVAAHAKTRLPTRSALSDPTRAIAIKPLLDRAAE